MSLPAFASFFRALWGHDPFPWQDRLADRVAREGWPRWITLPTGAGKTATIDIAVHALALQAARPASERTAPVRIVFAVNRRIVVDEASDRAQRIAARLRDAAGRPSDPLHGIARALAELGGAGGPPLEVYPLRGGTFTDHSWARTPTQPLVLGTTLDQLGSRLLFRGYGVSEFARPIHAALLAEDALVLLDEAHTSRAFSQTLQGIERLRTRASAPLRLPFCAVQLTATPPAEASATFELDERDRDHALLGRRVRASKPTRLIEAAGAKGNERHAKLATVIAAEAATLVAGGARRTLVVVNRVGTALAVEAELSKSAAKKRHDAEVLLLNGRIRPLDRQHLVKRLAESFGLKDAEPPVDVGKLILVATQCIEVGADFDFDGLVSELAPLDSLRQRMGRLNRTGRAIAAPAVVVAPEEALAEDAEDPIYGKCLPTVWTWLKQARLRTGGSLDFGISGQESLRPEPSDLPGLLAPAPDAPILLAPHLDLLCQTSPVPHVEPDPSVYIHGPGRDLAEIGVVLRADLGEAGESRLAAAPPLGAEAASLPIHEARRWLVNAKATADGADAPESIGEPGRRDEVPDVPCYRWRDGMATRVASPSDLRPGDVLVVPAQLEPARLAGLLRLQEDSPLVLDQFERAHLLTRDRVALRVHRDLMGELLSVVPDDQRIGLEERLGRLFSVPEEGGEWTLDLGAWSREFPSLVAEMARSLPEWHPARDPWVRASGVGERRWRFVEYPPEAGPGVLALLEGRVGATAWPLDPEDLGRQSNESRDEVLLADHEQAVLDLAKSFGAKLLPAHVASLGESARWHDLGKRDPRFQALLQGRPFWAVDPARLLAKSAPRSATRAASLREQSGLPEGFRHELVSAAILVEALPNLQLDDPDLVLHLVASHHGRCRAFAPLVADPAPEPIEVALGGATIAYPGRSCPLGHLDDGVQRRFWSLTRRHGWWGLAYLETLLRLADQRASAEG